MIQLTKSGNAIKFIFDENDHYLYNGTIEVPVNSLTLVTDESGMFTFKKSATNDIFISGLYSEIGMTKAELETFYKENMVGATGGGSGSGGTTPEEVQEMIDESISGLAESSAVTLEISEATSGKVDADSLATVATSGSYDDLLNRPTIPTVPTDVSAFNNDAGYITSDALNGYATEQWVDQQGYITGVDLSNYATLQDIPDVSNYFDGAEYDSGTTRINFYHGNTVKAYIDASAFIVDGMIDDVRIETISGASYLVIDFNTASGKEDIQIPLTDIFDPNNYYDKDAIDGIVSGLNTSINTKLDASAYTPTDLSEYWTSAQTQSAITSATNDMATQTWVNNQGFLTEHQSLSAYSTTEEVNTAIEEATSGKADTSAVTAVNDTLTAHTADTNIHVTSADKTAWNAKSDFSGSYNDLTDKPTIPTVPTDVSAFNNDAGYITEDALNGYAESSAVTAEITAAVSGKQDTLSAGTGISISGNVISATGGGGGTTYTAGRGINISNDTISVSLPILSGSGQNSIMLMGDGYNNAIGDYSFAEGASTEAKGEASHAEGVGCIANGEASHAEGISATANGDYSHAEGNYTKAYGESSHAEGADTKANNYVEHASGRYNVSSSASTTFGDSGNTLFSVGNGTAENARHNAFEIRQNGDIYITSGGTDIKLQDNLGGGGSGSQTVELTQAEYDALVSAGTVSQNTYYIITDATPVDVSNYWTSAQTQSAITQATSGKVNTSSVVTAVTSASTDNEIPTAKAVFDAIPTGGTGGGKAISAGTNISVTTGATVDTINCTLPIVVGGGFNNCLDLTYGSGNENSGSRNVTLGAYTKTTNSGELAIGRYNVSNTSSTAPIYNNPDKTVFSVGNGTADKARHNAFEIRQNGDIYITSGGTDIKLQDNLGGGSVSSAVTSGDTNAVSSDAVYTAMGGLKLQQITQAAYDALVSGGTVDASTLYIITNVVN